MTTATRPTTALSQRPSLCTACRRTFPTFALRCPCGSTLIILQGAR